MENKFNYIPVKDYATKYNESLHNVYNLIKRGKIKGVKLWNYQLVEDKPRVK